MNTREAQRLTDQVAQLPRERQAEVLDFVQFLLQREQQERQLSQVASRLFEPSLEGVWNNAEDAVCDLL